MSEATIITPPVEQLQGEQEVVVEKNPQDEVSSSTEVKPESASTQDNQEADGEQQDNVDEGTQEKKATGIERRFKKFQNQINAQAQELEYWKNVAINGGAKPVAAQAVAPEAPKLADFDNVEDFIAAREQHLRQQLIAEMQQQAAAVAQSKQIASTYETRVREAQKELPDWQEVMLSAMDEPTAPETVEFCMESEVGPKIAYYLAKNPEFHEKINNMSPTRRLAELGKIEDKVSGTNKGAQPRVTKAPQKMADVKGNNDSPISKNSSEAKSYAEWKALRERNKAK